MPTYQVQILSDEEFDSLPYKGISDSLGIADKEKGLAFVRRTGIKDFDEVTLHHEIDELVEKHSNHEDEYGIRHKKGGVMKSIVPMILGLVPVVGPILSAIASIGMNQYAQRRHPDQLGKPGKATSVLMQGVTGYLSGMGASNALQGGMAGGTAAAPGFLSKAGGIVGGSLVGTAPTATVGGSPGLIGSGGNLLGMGTGSLAPIGTGATSTNAAMGLPAASGMGLAPSATSTFGSIAPGASTAAINSQLLGNLGTIGAGTGAVGLTGVVKPLQGPVTSAQAGQGMATLPNTPTMPPSISPPAGAAGAATPPVTPAPAGFMESIGKGISSFTNKPENLLGLGSLVGSTMVKQPQFQMPESVEDIRGKLLSGGGLTPLGTQARTALSGIMAAKPTELYPTGTDVYYQNTLKNLENEYSRQKKALAQQWNAIDPNFQNNGEYIIADDRLNKSYMEVRNNFVSQEEQRRFELARSTQYQAIQDSLGVDKNTLDGLLGLTGLDVNAASAIYGVQEKDVTELRTALGTMGSELLIRGQQPKEQPQAGANNMVSNLVSSLLGSK